MNIGTKLKALRVEKGYKLREVAAQFNVTIRAISRYEDGTREPSLDLLAGFCKFYDVSADYLLGLTDNY